MVQNDYTVSDAQWEVIAGLLPGLHRKRRHSLRSIWQALLWLTHTGCQWRALSGTLPWQTAYWYFQQYQRCGIFEEVLNALVVQQRQANRREPEPSLLILDSQSCKAPLGGEATGYDGHKRLRGRKRHIAVDTLGLPIVLMVTSAALSDTAGARLLLRQQRSNQRLRHILVDQGYKRSLVEWTRRSLGAALEIVHRTGSHFTVMPKRWIVERSFAWINWMRRLSKDYERTLDSSDAFIRLLLNRSR